MADGSDAGRSVTSKVLALIAAFETGPPARSLTELAEVAGLTMPTAHRLAGELLRWGALDRASNGRYRLGARLWEVAQHAGPALRDTARPFLQGLFSHVQETTHFAVRQGDDALYIDVLCGVRRLSGTSRVGARAALHATAVGKVLLAYQASSVRETYLTRTLDPSEGQSGVHRTQLADELVKIRRRAFATSVEGHRPQTASLAVPVRHRQKRIVAAIGLETGPDQAERMIQHLPMLHDAARRIEAAVDRYPWDYLTIASNARP